MSSFSSFSLIIKLIVSLTFVHLSLKLFINLIDVSKEIHIFSNYIKLKQIKEQFVFIIFFQLGNFENFFGLQRFVRFLRLCQILNNRF